MRSRRNLNKKEEEKEKKERKGNGIILGEVGMLSIILLIKDSGALLKESFLFSS